MDFILTLPVSLDKLLHFEASLFQTPASRELLEQSSYQVKTKINNAVFTEHAPIQTVYRENTPVCSKTTCIAIDQVNSIPNTVSSKEMQLIEPCKTNILCWWCCHRFDSVPVYAPVKYTNKKELFHVRGIFCGFSCCYAYVLKEPVFKDKSLLKFMYKQVTGNKFDILPAPPREVLQVFGGSKTIEDFRRVKEGFFEIKMNYYPFVYLPQQVETKEISKLIEESVSNIKKNKETKIHIKRTQSKKTVKEEAVSGSLENLLGIVVS
jgi:hypothetical protein